MLPLTIAKLKVPFPGTTVNGTDSSAHVPVATTPNGPTALPGTGALAQVIAVSVQVLPDASTCPPTGLESATHRRSLALVTEPISPATVNLTYERYSGLGARTCSVAWVPKFLVALLDLTRASAVALKVSVVAARVG